MNRVSIDCGIADGYSNTDDKTTIPYIHLRRHGDQPQYLDAVNSDTTIATQERIL